MMTNRFKFNDGGRAAAGFRGTTGDCVTRAIAIATGAPYLDVYTYVNSFGKVERKTRQRRGKKSSARTGVFKPTTRAILESLGWEWHPTMQVGKGCTTHLRAEELPGGTLIVSVSHHLVAVVDGVIHDNHDCSRDGTRCVYGYWTKGPQAKLPPSVPPVVRKAPVRRAVSEMHQQATDRARELGVTVIVKNTDRNILDIIELETPKGFVLGGSGLHDVSIRRDDFRTNAKPQVASDQLWQAALDEMAYGIDACEDPECDFCHPVADETN